MPKVKTNTPAGSRRKKIVGITVENGLRQGTVSPQNGISPIRAVAVKETPIRRRRVAGRLVASMDLDEMLEASKIVEMGFRGEKLPTVKSPKVKKYVGAVLKLNKKASTKLAAKKMQQNLNIQIIERNKETINEKEAIRLYHELMAEE